MPEEESTKRPRSRKGAPRAVDVGPPTMVRTMLPQSRDDLVRRIHELATHVALFARKAEDERTNLARAASVLEAVACELGDFGPTTEESRAIKTMFRAARAVLPKPERDGWMPLWEVETGRHDTAARDELRRMCGNLADTFAKAWPTRGGSLAPREHRAKLEAMFSNAAWNLSLWLMLRIPSALPQDEDVTPFAERVGRRLAEVAEENASKDRVRYRDEARPPRVSGDDVLRAMVWESRLSMREHFSFADKPSKRRKVAAESRTTFRTLPKSDEVLESSTSRLPDGPPDTPPDVPAHSPASRHPLRRVDDREVVDGPRQRTRRD